MNRQNVTNWCLSNLEQAKIIRGGSEILARCPICGDSKKDKKKKRFHVNHDKFSSTACHCFNCGWSGSIVALIMHVEKCDVIRAKEIAGIRVWGNIKSSWDRIAPLQEDVEPDEEASIYNMIIDSMCFPLTEKVTGIKKSHINDKAHRFLESRGLEKDLYPYYVCFEGRYANRLIIPIMNDETIVYFQARALSDKQEPKYLNPPSGKMTIVLNSGCFDPDRPVIILEGLLDCLTLMNEDYTNVSCSLGKEPSEEMIKKILEEIDREVIVCMDNDQDGLKGTLKTWQIAAGNRRIRYFLLSKYYSQNDINDIVVKGGVSPQEVIRRIEDHSISSQMLPMMLKTSRLLPGGKK
jgi:hypothetical protein